jgi:hypothetical protein
MPADELRQQVAVRAVHLDRSEPGAHAARRRGAKGRDDLIEITCGRRLDVEVGFDVCAGAQARQPADGRIGAQPTVKQLHATERTTTLHARSQSRETSNHCIVVCTELARPRLAALVHIRGAGADQTELSVCARTEKPKLSFADGAVCVRLHIGERGEPDAVLRDCPRAKDQRLSEWR